MSLYIVSTYKPNELIQENFRDAFGKVHFYPNFLLGTHIYFLLEYLMKIYTAKSALSYLVKLDSLIDLTTTVPYIVSTLILSDNRHFIMFFCRMLDLFRIL